MIRVLAWAAWAPKALAAWRRERRSRRRMCRDAETYANHPATRRRTS